MVMVLVQVPAMHSVMALIFQAGLPIMKMKMIIVSLMNLTVPVYVMVVL